MISASQISQLKRCPRKYQYLYVEGLEETPSNELHTGNLLHTGILHYLLTKDIEKAKEKMKLYYNKKVAILLEEEEEGIKIMQNVNTILTNFEYWWDKQPESKMLNIYDCEIKVDGKLEEEEITGRIDFIGKMKDKMWIGEIKTRSKIGDSYLEDLYFNSQTYLYHYLFGYSFPSAEVGGTIFIIVRTVPSAKLPNFYIDTFYHSDLQMQSWMKDVSAMIQVLEGYKKINYFPLTNIDYACGSCSFRSLCLCSIEQGDTEWMKKYIYKKKGGKEDVAKSN